LGTFDDQVRLVAESTIVIAEHGGFHTNVMFMRPKSLLIDLRGPYKLDEARDFEALAYVSRVYYAHVIAQGIVNHDEKAFTMTQSEMEYLGDMVADYLGALLLSC
jgi:capsular polysaccharide biosynthesis protein